RHARRGSWLRHQRFARPVSEEEHRAGLCSSGVRRARNECAGGGSRPRRSCADRGDSILQKTKSLEVTGARAQIPEGQLEDTMAYPDDRKYTKEHEWVMANGTSASIGITQYAQDSLG